MVTSGVRTCAAVGGTRTAMMAMGPRQWGQRCSPLAVLAPLGTSLVGVWCGDVGDSVGTTFATALGTAFVRSGTALSATGAEWSRWGRSLRWCQSATRQRGEQ